MDVIAKNANDFFLIELPEDRSLWLSIASDWITMNSEVTEKVKQTVLAEEDRYTETLPN